MSTKPLLAILLACAAAHALAHHVEKAGPPVPPAKSVAAVPVAGFVTETIVDNRIAGTSSRMLILHADDGTRSVLLGPGASGLTPGASYVVTARPSGQALFVDSARMTSALDARANRLSMSPVVTLDGTLRLGHADNFDGGPSTFFYGIVGEGSQYRVAAATLAEGLENGMGGSVTGHLADDGELVADRIVILTTASEKRKAAADAAPVTTSYIVLPIKFPTNATAPFTYNADPFTVASIQSAVFGASNSVGHFYVETSYGQQALSGTTADDGSGGWLLAERALPATCDINVIATAAENAATLRGYNLASYAGRIYVFTNNVPGCGWAGLAYVGWARSYIKQTTSLLVIGHEVGHNFGMLHAASLDCGTNVIGGTCTSAEYGDPFDIMGNNRAMHPNAAQKADLGWIAPSTVKTHTTGRATYTLTPIETAGGATYAVKIPAATNRTYWLEYRQPIGYDSGLSSFPNNGAQFRVASPFESICSGCADDTEFLDLTPATSAFTDGALVLGQSYNDAYYGFQVSVTAATPTSLTLTVAALGDPPKPDFDGSGGTDLVWRNASAGQTALWLMNGSSATTSTMMPVTSDWSAKLVGDFNGDAKSDIVWRNGVTGQTALWLMNGTATSSSAMLMSDANWSVVQAADLNGDGKSDLVWRNASTGQTAVWLMNGTAVSSAAVLLSDANWSVTHTGDFNGDGKTDLVWRNAATGQTALWLMNGSAVLGSATLTADGTWSVVAVGDLNGDGKSDLVWRNNTTGQTAVWIMNVLAPSSTAVLAVPTNWSVTHAADFDGDGKSDLVWRNASTGETAVWLMNGTVPASTATLSYDGNWSVLLVGDYNGDGKADLVWTNASTGATAMWIMNGGVATSTTVLAAPGWSPTRVAQ
ncbi:MAG: FG-GAP-like repeat-containing protein [Burkholderiales bacterium]